ncbi:unnamed protein product [Arctogadus glacialis]
MLFRKTLSPFCANGIPLLDSSRACLSTDSPVPPTSASLAPDTSSVASRRLPTPCGEERKKAPPSQVSHKLRGACVFFLFFPRPVASPWVVLGLCYFSVRVHWPWRPRACEYISPAVTVGDRCEQREDGQVAAQASAITAG